MKRKTLSTLILLFLCASLASAAERFVQVEGSQVHVVERGSGINVVFESGVGEDTQTWSDVEPEIAKFAHTFAYDRPGIGKSEPTARPRTVQQMVEDLRAVLVAAQVKPPYILVGHSLGGALVQVFAHAYPSEVAGLVLCDPEDGRLIDLLHKNMPPEQWEARKQSLDQMMSQASPAQRAELKGATEGGEAVAQAVPLPKVPIVLFTGTLKNPEFPGNPLEQDLKLQLQNAFAANTPQVEHVLVPNSRHYIQNDVPQLVIDVVKKLATRVGLARSAP
jgi:pimeloyl-ACP methyl ester carboxylesterase